MSAEGVATEEEHHSMLKVLRRSAVPNYKRTAAGLLSKHGEAVLAAPDTAVDIAVDLATELREIGLATVTKLETTRVKRKNMMRITIKKSDGFDAALEKFEETLEVEGWSAIDKLNVKNATGRDKHGEILVDTTGKLRKPSQKGGRTDREVGAFAKLHASPLGPYLPAFYGEVDFQGNHYLEMENVLFGLSQPLASCDIKMGVKTWDENAPEGKKERERKKIHPGKCSELGFRLVGVQAGSTELKHYDIVDRKGLTPEEFRTIGMLPFFRSTDASDPSDTDKEAVRFVVSELNKILSILEQGYGGVLRAASIFLAREMKPEGKKLVKVIDLAHFTETEEKDDNFIEGLKNLIKHLEMI